MKSPMIPFTIRCSCDRATLLNLGVVAVEGELFILAFLVLHDETMVRVQLSPRGFPRVQQVFDWLHELASELLQRQSEREPPNAATDDGDGGMSVRREERI